MTRSSPPPPLAPDTPPPAPIALVDGRWERCVDATDRGLAYGDGVFRTVRVEGGTPLWWQDHMDKLTGDAQRLGIPCPAPSLWEADIAELLQACQPHCVVKLLLTRGIGPRGYRAPQPTVPTRAVIASPRPPDLDVDVLRGVNMRICQLRLSQQPRLAGVKHMNRLENILARLEWDSAEFQEGLLLDADGRVISSVSGNLFIHLHGELLTPDLSRCGVAGVARARVLRRAERLKIPARVADIGLDDVYGADEIMLTNSLIKLQWVARLGDRHWHAPRLSPMLRAALDD